jgi:hypothetical protein
VARLLEFAKTQRKLGGSGSWHHWTLAWGAELFEQCKTQRKLGGWCSWPDWVVVCEWVGVGRLFKTEWLRRQNEDVSFSRWFVFWNSQRKHRGDIFRLWIGRRVV